MTGCTTLWAESETDEPFDEVTSDEVSDLVDAKTEPRVSAIPYNTTSLTELALPDSRGPDKLATVNRVVMTGDLTELRRMENDASYYDGHGVVDWAICQRFRTALVAAQNLNVTLSKLEREALMREANGMSTNDDDALSAAFESAWTRINEAYDGAGLR